MVATNNTTRRKRPPSLPPSPSSSLPLRVFAIRRRNWLEIRIGVKRPVRRLKREQVGKVKLSMVEYAGGELVGVIPYYPRYIRLTSGKAIYLPEIVEHRLQELSGAVRDTFLDPSSRGRILGGI